MPGRYEIIESNYVPLWRNVVCGENGANAVTVGRKGAIVVERQAEMFADFLGDHRGEVALLVSAFGCGDNSIVFGRKERADDRPNERSNIVGDDDQNVFEFRGSNSRYMNLLLQDTGGRFVEMTENFNPEVIRACGISEFVLFGGI